jgi:hypothetical protein
MVAKIRQIVFTSSIGWFANFLTHRLIATKHALEAIAEGLKWN